MLTIVLLVLIVAISIWVYMDAKKLGFKEGKVESCKLTGLSSLGPGSWCVFCLCFGIIGIPLYFYQRSKFIKK